MLHHLGIGALGVAAAWYGFGFVGAASAILWAWYTRPAPVPWGARWFVPLADVKRVRLGPWRTRILFRQGGVLDIYRDEMDGAELARLRRTLSARFR